MADSRHLVKSKERPYLGNGLTDQRDILCDMYLVSELYRQLKILNS